MNAAVAEMPDPEENPEVPNLLDRGRYGTSRDMKAEDTKSYTVDDEFRLSWMRKGLRERGIYKGVRDCIKDGELNEDLAGMVSQYMSYLMLIEHGIAPDDKEILGKTYAVDANFGTNTAKVRYKVVI